MTLRVEEVLAEYGITARVASVAKGPVITSYELTLGKGVRAKTVISLESDLARGLEVQSARITTQPGKSTLMVEVPNEDRETITFQELIKDSSFVHSDSELPIILGRDVNGLPIVADLALMPHLLVAGTTGSGKSVGVNAMIMSLLHCRTAEQVEMVMIDPKMLELSPYEGIPHLRQPVVTDMSLAVEALSEVVDEMERRYALFAEARTRGIKSYNELNPASTLPYIVVVVDEFADLMMMAKRDVEPLVQRIAQKARAAGIHMILATQRPSVDVVTGVIKANFPSRISFQVASAIDSRTILDETGGEALLGRGDMILKLGSKLQRVHGPFVSDIEVGKMVDSLVDDFQIIEEFIGEGGLVEERIL